MGVERVLPNPEAHAAEVDVLGLVTLIEFAMSGASVASVLNGFRFFVRGVREEIPEGDGGVDLGRIRHRGTRSIG